MYNYNADLGKDITLECQLPELHGALNDVHYNLEQATCYWLRNPDAAKAITDQKMPLTKAAASYMYNYAVSIGRAQDFSCPEKTYKDEHTKVPKTIEKPAKNKNPKPSKVAPVEPVSPKTVALFLI